MEIAIKNNLPVVIHCRKANHKLFKYKKQLSKLPEVLFHSFMGPSAEALSLLNSDINGYFSFLLKTIWQKFQFSMEIKKC